MSNKKVDTLGCFLTEMKSSLFLKYYEVVINHGHSLLITPSVLQQSLDDLMYHVVGGWKDQPTPFPSIFSSVVVIMSRSVTLGWVLLAALYFPPWEPSHVVLTSEELL